MRGRVFVYGSINTDLVVYVAKLPLPGETVSGGTSASFPGGKGANQAVAAALAGAAADENRGVAVEMFGCVGDDAVGRERLASLSATGVSTRGVRVVAGIHSGIVQVMVDAEGENTMAVAPGANMKFSAEGVEVNRPPKGDLWVSVFQNEVPREATEALIVKAHAAGHLVIWNVAPTIGLRPKPATLAAVVYLVCNRNELRALTKDWAEEGRERAGEPAADEEDESLARLPLAWGVRNLIVTLGRQGSLWVNAAGTFRQPAFRVEAVDTVGAGDCFCGVFASSLAEGRDPKEALVRASAAAAISTTRKGAQTSMPRRGEIERFLAQGTCGERGKQVP
ncbi:MAG: ribokinase [Spirochaetes bacterium]|nr:ribokinase [Spirochaetota bacterium]